MDTKAKNPNAPFPKRNMNPVFRGGRKNEHRRSYYGYYGLESLFVLVCLAASLLLLPLVLPPLPPPPLMLLLLPIGILAVLVILAFRPTTTVNRDVTQASM